LRSLNQLCFLSYHPGRRSLWPSLLVEFAIRKCNLKFPLIVTASPRMVLVPPFTFPVINPGIAIISDCDESQKKIILGARMKRHLVCSRWPVQNPGLTFALIFDDKQIKYPFSSVQLTPNPERSENIFNCLQFVWSDQIGTQGKWIIRAGSIANHITISYLYSVFTYLGTVDRRIRAKLTTESNFPESRIMHTPFQKNSSRCHKTCRFPFSLALK
jgi:hypothetical protein